MAHPVVRYSHANRLQVGDRQWSSLVEARLFEGYGVEDIALWLNCHVSHVRRHVEILRRQRVLRAWWGR